MPRLSDDQINQRVRAAMMPAMQSLTETGKRQKIGGASFDSLIRKAQQRRSGQPKTEKEREATHLQRFGAASTPPGGTGLGLRKR